MNKTIVIFDLDGTAVQKGLENGVDKLTVETVKKAQNSGIIMIAATGRRASYALPILQELGLKNFSITNNGAQIINPLSGKIIHEYPMSALSLDKLYKLMLNLNFETVYTDGNSLYPFTQNLQNKTVGIYIKSVIKQDAIKLAETINRIDGLISHVSHPWNHDHENYYAIDVNDKKATKQHAIRQVIKDLQLTEDTRSIGIGDGGNDAPLLEFADYAVAVNTAPGHIKALADKLIDPPEKSGFVTYIQSLF